MMPLWSASHGSPFTATQTFCVVIKHLALGNGSSASGGLLFHVGVFRDVSS